MAGGGIESVVASVSKPVKAPDLRRRQSEGREAQLELGMLPPGCPITPLGIQGLKLWILDSANQLLPIATDCRKGDLILVFGGDSWLRANFPRFAPPKKDQPPEIIGFDQADAQAAIIQWCVAKEIFDPQGKVFGRGAHRAGEDDDQLVLHMGRSVLIANARDIKGKPLTELQEHDAGKVDEKFFPALAPLPAPADEPSTAEEAEALHALFGQWYWAEPEAAKILMLGMSAQMHICGALGWRSHVWLAGPTAAGKSSLQKVLRALHGGWCLHTEDASEAAVRQVLKDDTLPVLIDEAEADDNPERQRAILNLMKKASSGGKLHRGAADHRAQEFTAQSCFLLSSVLHSLAKGEEWNRVAVLDMKIVPEDAPVWEAPDLKRLREVGRRMHRRMIEQWPRFDRTLSDYKRAIHAHGAQGRWQDTFGTLLACADLLLHDRAPSAESELNEEYGREKRHVLSILPLITRGQGQARSDVERCIAWLMASQIPGSHGAPAETVGQWIVRAMDVLKDEADSATGGINHKARDRLASYGLKLGQVRPTKAGAMGFIGDLAPGEPGWEQGWLAVAYPTSEPLKRLFAGSGDWAGGAWVQSLSKVDGAERLLKVRFVTGMAAQNAVVIPLKALR